MAAVRNRTRSASRTHALDIRVRPECTCYLHKCKVLAHGMEIASNPVGSHRTGRGLQKYEEVEMQIGLETSKAVDQRRVFVIDDDEITRAALQFMLHDE